MFNVYLTQLSKKTYTHLVEDTLYRNSLYLMVSTFIMGFLGFIFWIICARIYTTDQIGIATTLISVANLVTTFSLAGMNLSLIRYLPSSVEKNKIINTAFTLVGLFSLFFGIIYIFLIPIFTPILIFIQNNILILIIFILFMPIYAVNNLSDNVFIAYRSTKYILIYYCFYSITKLLFPLIFTSLGSIGIYLAVSISTFIALILTFHFLHKYFKHKYNSLIDIKLLTRMIKFSIGNYIASILASLPMLLLPIIITNMLGPKYTAYYYMPMMIISFLYIIPQATTRSLFAEGSHEEENIGVLIIKSLNLNILLLLPAILIIVFFGKYILFVFGSNYSIQGNSFLQLLAISGIFNYINSVGGAILNIKFKLTRNIIFIILSNILFFSLCYLFISKGLTGIGIAWIINQVVFSIVYFIEIVYFSNIKF